MENNLEAKLTGFFSKNKLLKFKKGEVIFRPGDDFSQVSFVKSGYVRLYSETKNGKEITINLFKPIFYLSLMFATNRSENKYFFEAITPVELWKAPYSEVADFFNNDPETLNWLNAKLLKTLDELLNNIQDTTSGDSYNKIVSLILSLAHKFGKTENGQVTVDFQTTHRVIASLAGTSRETASIQIKKMEKEGLIVQKNKQILIPDIEKLQNLSQN